MYRINSLKGIYCEGAENIPYHDDDYDVDNDDNDYDDDVDGWCSGKTFQIFSFIHKSETLYRNK